LSSVEQHHANKTTDRFSKRQTKRKQAPD
jgi:hypothetical protein